MFTYDAPIVSDVRAVNGVIDLTSTLTISGMNIGGVTDLQPTVRIGYTTCHTSHYLSDSSVLCSVNLGTGSRLPMVITTSEIITSIFTPFTYDGPVATWLKAHAGAVNGPTNGDTAY